MWQENDINLGKIKAKSKNRLTFTFNEEPGKRIKIENVLTRCDCVTATYSQNRVNVTFVPNGVPNHIKELGLKTFHSLKEVIVFYRIGDETELKDEVLTIRAEIED